MKIDKLLKMLLPEVLIENFDVVDSQRNENRLDLYFDEKKVQTRGSAD